MTISSSKVLSLLKRSIISKRTYHVQWMITRRCNYRCRGCNVWMDQDHEELSAEEVKRGLDILRDIGVLEIVFSGGNPLIRDDIGELLDYASQYFITTVYDNGSMAAEKIDDIRSADFVAISIDTLDEKKNDYLKGVKGAWRRAMNAIFKLKAEGIHVGVSPTISQLNLYEIIDFTKYFIEREIPVWYCLYWYDHPFKNGMFSIGKKNDECMITDMKKLAEVCKTLKKMKRENNYIYITDKTLDAVIQLALTGERIWKCKALQSFLVVDHLGRVAGCHSREPVASIFDLPDAWDSPRFDKLRIEYSKCTKCAYMCYIFYSVHTGFSGLIQILRGQWRNANLLIREEPAITTSTQLFQH
ncbi:TPA: radical SAM protein [Candidatus Bathyarchaeota archaeon]|nr:radical SAM protein [Candidatus Bathyarchaeota archaeon]